MNNDELLAEIKRTDDEHIKWLEDGDLLLRQRLGAIALKYFPAGTCVLVNGQFPAVVVGHKDDRASVCVTMDGEDKSHWRSLRALSLT
jgi:hypothetical protein